MRQTRVRTTEVQGLFPGVFEAEHGEGSTYAEELALQAEAAQRDEHEALVAMAMGMLEPEGEPGALLREIEMEILGIGKREGSA